MGQGTTSAGDRFAVSTFSILIIEESGNVGDNEAGL